MPYFIQREKKVNTDDPVSVQSFSLFALMLLLMPLLLMLMMLMMMPKKTHFAHLGLVAIWGLMINIIEHDFYNKFFLLKMVNSYNIMVL